MLLVVDTNILASALIRNANTRQILLSTSFKFFLPEYSLEELKDNWDFIIRKSKLSERELEQLLLLLLKNLTVVPESSYTQFIHIAQDIMSAIDIDDAPFLALALSFHNDGIWSNDKDFVQGTPSESGNQLFVFGKQMSCLHSWKNESCDSAQATLRHFCLFCFLPHHQRSFKPQFHHQ